MKTIRFNPSKTGTFTALALLLSALSAAPAWAQEQAETDTSGLGDIIVTAERRAASVQETPISITALSGKALQDAGITSTESLVNATPGLLVQRSVVGKISIRGVGNENYTIAGDPGVAVHTDGVYIARASAGLFDLFDIQRVEVLRGPQGTLYGRNATGGVINIIPNTPTDEFEAYASGEYGNYDKARFEGMLSGPLGGGLKARVAVLGAWRDGYTKNIFPGAKARGLGDLDNQDLWAVRGQLQYDASDTFEARLAVEYLKDDSNLPAYKYLNQPNALPNENYLLNQRRTVSQGFELAIPGASRDVGSDEDIFKTNQLGLGLHLKFNIGDYTLKTITGFRDTDFNWLNDGDGADIFYVNYIQQDSTKQYSQEIQLASPEGDQFSWIVGAFWFRETGDTFIALPFTFGAGLPFYIEINGSAKTRALAGFGELNWKATDKLKITLGARYNNEKRSTEFVYDINFGSLFRRNFDDSETFNSFTPRAVINYEATDDLNIYASATRGFKSGGYNLLAFQEKFDPEKVWSFEAGFKSTFADNRVRFNANIFYMDYKDMQVGQIVNLSSVITNAARSRLYGLEAELQTKPLENLEIGGTLAYLNAKFKDFCTGDPTQPSAPISAGCNAANPIQLSGNRLPRAPEWTLTGYFQVSDDFEGFGNLAFRGDIRYQSQVYFTQFNRSAAAQPPGVEQKGYAIANARLTWTSGNEIFQVAAWMNNVFDKDYFTEVLESGAFNPQLVSQGYVAPPRTYGLTVSARF
jgi:iron complex outermembrane recepter protein